MAGESLEKLIERRFLELEDVIASLAERIINLHDKVDVIRVDQSLTIDLHSKVDTIREELGIADVPDPDPVPAKFVADVVAALGEPEGWAEDGPDPDEVEFAEQRALQAVDPASVPSVIAEPT